MKAFNGYLFSRLNAIGTFSEGPRYFLQLLTESEDILEIPIIKKSNGWDIDPRLHQFLAKKVTIKGELVGEFIDYTEIKSLTSAALMSNGQVELSLKFEGNSFSEGEQVLYLNKMPSPVGPPPELEMLRISLHYKWQEQSIYHAQCPTNQFFEFLIKDPYGDLIWQWSNSVLFIQTQSGFELIGNYEYKFPVEWHYFSDAITNSGNHTVVASFLASGQEVSKILEIKFAL